MGQIKFANNAVSRLVGPLTTSSASLTVTPGDGAQFPVLGAGDWFMATLIRADGAREIVKVTSRTVDAMSINRAQENTAALAFSPNDRIEARLTSGSLDEFMRRDGSMAMQGILDMATYKIGRVGDPAAAGDAANKGYADSLVASGKNGFGARTVSTAAPSGGNDGDIWYQV